MRSTNVNPRFGQPYCVLRLSPSTLSMSAARTRRALALASGLVFLTLATSSALSFRPTCDEAWFFNPAYNLVTKGHMGTTVIEPEGHYRRPQGINQYTYWIPPLHILAQASWYRLVGPGLISMRALSIFWGLVALGSWYLIVRALFQNRTLAVVVFSVLAVDDVVISTAADGRMDMMSSGLGYGALAAYLQLRERSYSGALLLSHTLVAASGLTHPIGGVASFCGLLVLTLWLDRQRIRLHHFAFALTPYLVGAASWGLYILENPQLFLVQFANNSAGRFSLLTEPLKNIQSEISRYLSAYGFASYSSGITHVKILILLSYVAGMAILCTRPFRQQTGTGVFLALASVYWLVLLVFDSPKLVHYLIYAIPFLCVSFAMCAYWLWTKRRLPRMVIALVVAAVISLQLTIIVHRFFRLRSQKQGYVNAVAFLRDHGAQHKLTMASGALGFGLGFVDTLRDDPTLGFRTGKKAEFIVVDDLHYELEFQFFSRKNSDLHEYIQHLLSEEYRLVYAPLPYRIYARK